MNGTWFRKVTTNIVRNPKPDVLLDYSNLTMSLVGRPISRFVTFTCGIACKLYQQNATKRKKGRIFHYLFSR
jgi:hypothetical protein